MAEFNKTDIKVTRINKWYHIRLYVNDKLYEEQACQLKCDIGTVARDMLRWYDKCGGLSWQAHRTRQRMNKKNERIRPIGKTKRIL